MRPRVQVSGYRAQGSGCLRSLMSVYLPSASVGHGPPCPYESFPTLTSSLAQPPRGFCGIAWHSWVFEGPRAVGSLARLSPRACRNDTIDAGPFQHHEILTTIIMERNFRGNRLFSLHPFISPCHSPRIGNPSVSVEHSSTQLKSEILPDF